MCPTHKRVSEKSECLEDQLLDLLRSSPASKLCGCTRDRRETGLESTRFVLQAPTTKSVGCLHQPEAGRRWPGRGITVRRTRPRPCPVGLGLCATCAVCMAGTPEVDSAGAGTRAGLPGSGANFPDFSRLAMRLEHGGWFSALPSRSSRYSLSPRPGVGVGTAGSANYFFA